MSESDQITKWLKACKESRLGIVLPMPEPIQRLHDELERLKAENASLRELVELDKAAAYRIMEHLKAENARLEALTVVGCVNCGYAAEDGPKTALRDLLAPTIELLRQATLRPITWQDEVKAELARLRGIGEGK